eukprot:4288978-Pyramimonas_sp.AAC.1
MDRLPLCRAHGRFSPEMPFGMMSCPQRLPRRSRVADSRTENLISGASVLHDVGPRSASCR